MWFLCSFFTHDLYDIPVAEAGEDVSECFDSECLILVNHISTADVPVLMYSTLNKGHVTKRMHWIMDNLFKYTNFGIVSQFHGDFFILQVRAW